MAQGLGEIWTERLLRADTDREWWRPIVWQSREHYDGVTSKGIGQPVPYNKHRAAEDNVRAALQPDAVEVRFNAIRPEDTLRVKVAQLLTNWALRSSQFVETTNSFITHARTDGIGIYKVEFGGTWQPRVRVGNEGNTAIPGRPTDRGRRSPTGGDRAKAMTEAMRAVFPNALTGDPVPQASVIDVMDFLKDSETNTLEDSLFASHRAWLTRRQIERLQESGYYMNVELQYEQVLPSTRERWERSLVRRNARGDVAQRQRGQRSNAVTRDTIDAEEIWEVWEIHDRVEGRVLHVIPGMSKVLRDVPAEIEGMPYVDFRPSATPWSYWSIPDVFQYIAAQNTLDTLLSTIVKHVSKFAKTVIFTDNDIDDATKRQIGDAIDGEFISVNSIEGIKVQDFGSLPPDLTNVLGLLSQVINELSGISQIALGVGTGNTATEVNQISKFQSVRMRRQSIDLNQAFAKVSLRYLALLKEFAPPEVVVPVLGTDALEFQALKDDFVTVNRRDLTTEVDAEVKVGAGAQLQAEIDRKQKLDFWNLGSVRPDVFNIHHLASELVLAFDMRPRHALAAPAPPPPGPQILGPDGQPMEGSAGPVGRGAPQQGGPSAPEGPSQSPDQLRRTGNPSPANELTDLFRGGASR